MQTAVEKIRELRVLHEDGLLSLREFDSRKNAILDAEHAPAPEPPGTEIGLVPGMEIGPRDRRYRLERLIANGGMGQVWRAADLATEAELGHDAAVALKILPPDLTKDAARARMLVEEATQARKLAHENIVRVHEWARDPATGSYFLIMECLDGEDLESLLARDGPLPMVRALQLAAPLAAALDYAWDRHRLVHRDIKPGNIFITSKGDVKLLDFGIAAHARAGGEGIATAAGTAGYRAPEASTGEGEPARTLDVFSMAVTIHRMVEGRLPSDASEPRPTVLTQAQWDVLHQGFAPDPAARPASVTELLAALRGHPAPEPAPAPTELAPLVPVHERKRSEPDARPRAEREEERRARRELLSRQLRERRAQDAEARLAAQARAAAAYRAEQQRAHAAGVVRDAFIEGIGHGPQMLMIAPGRFLMGSPEHERRKAVEAGAMPEWLVRETPQRWVGVEQPFALGRFPVTVGEWRLFAEATGWRGHGDIDWNAPGFPQDDEHPVVGVSWNDAQQYVHWLAAQTGKPYRLPSEAEWEYACRAGTKTAFSFGDTIDTSLANYDGNYSYNGSLKGVFRGGTTPVGSFAPNPWGLYDMHGNVWEWVQDVAHDTYNGAPADARAWEEGGDPGRRILRGGSWLYHPRYLRSALRNSYAAANGNDIVGFRVARDA
ncbi:MAG: bifunctional serine/threonine-protein kinase/formylglycine-generating enzyme family protein [Telluria sp.]